MDDDWISVQKFLAENEKEYKFSSDSFWDDYNNIMDTDKEESPYEFVKTTDSKDSEDNTRVRITKNPPSYVPSNTPIWKMGYYNSSHWGSSHVQSTFFSFEPHKKPKYRRPKFLNKLPF